MDQPRAEVGGGGECRTRGGQRMGSQRRPVCLDSHPCQRLLDQCPRHHPSQGAGLLSRPLGTLPVCLAALNPGREGEVLSKGRLPVLRVPLQARAPVSLPCLCPTQGCHPALTIPGGAEGLFQTERREGQKKGFLSFGSYLPRSMANGPGCAIGWPASVLQFPSFLVLPGRRAMRNPKQDFKNKHGQINATRNLSGPSEGNEACDMKISSENSNPPK